MVEADRARAALLTHPLRRVITFRLLFCVLDSP